MINLSRQQKAVCTRERNKLTSLERHFTRQSHLEHFKQSCLIDKFKQRLERLNKLRSSPATEYSHIDNSRGFPIDYSTIAHRDIAGKPNTIIERNGLYKATVKLNRLPQTISDFQKDKNKGRCDNPYEEDNKRILRYQTRNNSGSHSPGLINNYNVYSGPSVTEQPISARQTKDRSLYQRYRSRDENRVRSNEICKLTLRAVKYNRNKSGLDNIKSDLLTTSENAVAERNFGVRVDNCNENCGTSSKTVRFKKAFVTGLKKNKIHPGEFKKLVQLSHSSRHSKEK